MREAHLITNMNIIMIMKKMLKKLTVINRKIYLHKKLSINLQTSILLKMLKSKKRRKNRSLIKIAAMTCQWMKESKQALLVSLL